MLDQIVAGLAAPVLLAAGPNVWIKSTPHLTGVSSPGGGLLCGSGHCLSAGGGGQDPGATP